MSQSEAEAALVRMLEEAYGEHDSGITDERARHEARVSLILSGCKVHAAEDAALAAYLRERSPLWAYLRPDVADAVASALALEVSHGGDLAGTLSTIVGGATIPRVLTVAAVVEHVLSGQRGRTDGDAEDAERRARVARGNNGGYA